MNDTAIEGMVSLQGGVFTMGSDRFYLEEAPARRVRVSPFLIDATPVTNAAFARFVAETGYRTLAEVAPDPADYQGMDPALAVPGSVVFTMTDRPVDTRDPSQWWRWVPGADWRHPTGPDSSITAIMDHPVVQVAWQDAAAYAAWAGKQLPTEAEHEFATRGGLEGRDYAWGDELCPDGRRMANTWHGLFPFANQAPDGWTRTSPVRAYPANPFGVYDLIGNVWEWCEDWWSLPAHTKKRNSACCVVDNPRGGLRAKSVDPAMPAIKIPRKVLKGGSHLCAPSYCQRYRPAARHPQAIDSATSNVGFRCVKR
ncbi:formylglycine-generating enzyme required for sulfatase activity [Bradyrhizobium macuxiense]|uniref:Formylglycine-generating enzyme required for sulfatase activity n=1 Tax=Bradyrhizobium macuxiense TaxID=1755647 RepID=A0A560KUI9_9BRAD|nr:formylglycine-generating enzyme family protein [Bradyrhizobium macuxiense]TWB86901.1 formylglycine-generating enzyme required for sulfatase activity [Bradyrhizobium macuxiense]